MFINSLLLTVLELIGFETVFICLGSGKNLNPNKSCKSFTLFVEINTQK